MHAAQNLGSVKKSGDRAVISDFTYGLISYVSEFAMEIV